MNTDTIGIPKIWAQYMNNKDCTLGFCSLYCPQWCYFLYPPPPPPPSQVFQSSGRNLSPLVITVICVLVGALLLVSYYAIISMYCRKRFSSTTTRHDQNNVDVELGVNHVHEPWFVATNGLDEALIESIATFKYKRGDGLVECSDCSVCLTEFVEDERLRILPKCSHAFHVQCIDAWLKCHSNCPLCRANVAAAGSISSPPSLPLHSSADEVLSQSQVEVENGGDAGDEESEETRAKTPEREWREGDEEGNRHIRRSFSMDCICERRRLSIADVLFVIDQEEINRPSVMKRSHSSGRWFFSKSGKTQE